MNGTKLTGKIGHINKELEALDRMSIHRFDDKYEEWDADYEIVENYLQSLDNANPSEALECVENIRERFSDDSKGNNSWGFNISKQLNTIKQTLLKAQEQEKVLEVIKEKDVSLFWLKGSKTAKAYNYAIDLGNNEYRQLTQEEFDLLKRYCDE